MFEKLAQAKLDGPNSPFNLFKKSQTSRGNT